MCEVATAVVAGPVASSADRTGPGRGGAAAVGAFVETTVGLVLIAAGAGLLLLAVVLPAVTEVELGFPAGVKVVAAARQRENQLRAA